MEKKHTEAACKYYEIAANRQYIPAMLKLALLYDKEDTLFEQLFWMDRMEWRTQSAEGFASDPYAVCRKAEKRSDQ